MKRSRSTAVRSAPGPRFIVVTGLSGAGKSAAIHALEDLGYFCVDNLPTPLVPAFADLVVSDSTPDLDVRRSAVVVDVRDPRFLDEFPRVLRGLRRRTRLGAIVTFVDAADEALVRRFSESRRPHPMARGGSVLDGILEERTRLAPIRSLADNVIDTTELTVHELRRTFTELSRGRSKMRLVVNLVSFGYKHGIPLESDLLLDVRFLPNPHFVPSLRRHTGHHQSVQRYVDGCDATKLFLAKATELLRFLVPQYAQEGKSYLTIGVGCTGGRHRSVVVAERLRRRLTGLDGVRLRVKHRDVLQDP